MELSSTPDIRARCCRRACFILSFAPNCVSHGGAVVVTSDIAVTCALMSRGCVVSDTLVVNDVTSSVAAVA
jgi:hypothetical protein